MAKQKQVAPEDSDDESQVPRPQPEQEDSSEEEEAATSSDEDEDTDQGEDEREKHVLVPRKPQPQKVSKPSSSSKLSPMLKSQPSASVSQTKSGSKRAAENGIDHSEQPKRVKKAQEDAQKSKSLFQRVFSEEDEIGILKGLSEFIAKTGKEPYKCADEFYDFMKGSNLIRANVSCMQVKEKIRRLKKKFENILIKEKNGKGTTLKPHELEALQLGKNVWGHDGRGGEAVLKETAKKDTVNNEKAAKKALVPHSKGKAEAKSKLNSEPLDSNEGRRMSEFSVTSLALTSMLRYDGTFGKPFGEDYIRKGIELLGVSKREDIEARWRKFKDAENRLYVEIAEFYAEQAKLIYQANSSSSS
ncbi:probable transcription factor At1g61730 isoform X2 [Arachis duranensis]|uniref:Probable transcription factor At1g61730 isoform X1 n=1 Tax=Arachis duranensis TaxID=130453 RepID=A0A6P4BVL0_ARADU|nr:probable transcription factor At1g61730 isoform X1 [Arachis duranensis]XP_052107858.1 probable transcription factor At1g61730 isoform X1 [Arachis duranensis]XP_052107859.1 probable transcription factor At1g61730 isoform X2 [Arachis duranensis]